MFSLRDVWLVLRALRRAAASVENPKLALEMDDLLRRLTSGK